MAYKNWLTIPYWGFKKKQPWCPPVPLHLGTIFHFSRGLHRPQRLLMEFQVLGKPLEVLSRCPVDLACSSVMETYLIKTSPHSYLMLNLWLPFPISSLLHPLSSVILTDTTDHSTDFTSRASNQRPLLTWSVCWLLPSLWVKDLLYLQ